MLKLSCSSNYRQCRLFHVATVYLKVLSSTQIANILRPFIFRVHPDLFGKYPDEQKVNESSLQKLNEYMNALHINTAIKSTELRFFLRQIEKNSTDSEECSSFKEINIHLKTQSTNETLRSVLKSAAIPQNDLNCLINNLNNDSESVSRKIEWSKSLSDLFGFGNSNFTRSAKPQLYFDLWLKKNIALAQKRQKSNKLVWKAIRDIKQAIYDDFGIKSIIWESRWSTLQQRICLASFNRFLSQNKDVAFLKIIAGKTIIFIQGTETGLDIDGNILLRSDDVMHHWYQIINSIHQQEHMVKSIVEAEMYTSYLLNGVQIKHPQSPRILISQDYLQQIVSFNSSIKNLLELHDDLTFDIAFRELELLFGCNVNKISLNSDGQMMIPYYADGKLALKYIIGNGFLAQNIMKKKQTKLKRKNAILDQLMDVFKLKSIAVETNIKLEQLESCYNNLLQERFEITQYLEDSQLSISHFYQIKPDGIICIPWNWKS